MNSVEFLGILYLGIVIYETRVNLKESQDIYGRLP